MKWLLCAATDRKTRLYQLEIHCVLFDRQIVHIRSTAVLMFWIIFVTTPHIWSSRSHLHLFSKTEAASLYTFVVHSTVDSSQLPHGVDGVEPYFIHIIHLNGWESFFFVGIWTDSRNRCTNNIVIWNISWWKRTDWKILILFSIYFLHHAHSETSGIFEFYENCFFTR